MMDPKAEGKADNGPQPFKLHSLQAATYNYMPYTTISTNNLNPCAEGLEESLVQESHDKEGVNADRPNRLLLQHQREPHYPGCCRRYSCCFPLIVIILVWLMMISSESFEHCPNCISSEPMYLCELESRADYYCKADSIQVCCYYGENECRSIAYPEELHYSMGEHFILSMRIVILICLFPLIVPCGVPYMLFKDCRKDQHSAIRQTVFDILCTVCFIAASVGCSWVVIKYYEFPGNRCSWNSELFGISKDKDNSLMYPNVWIMSQTTYSSFFGFMVLCSFSVLGSIILILQAISYRKGKE